MLLSDPLNMLLMQVRGLDLSGLNRLLRVLQGWSIRVVYLVVDNLGNRAGAAWRTVFPIGVLSTAPSVRLRCLRRAMPA